MKLLIDKVWIDNGEIYAVTTDGTRASYSIQDWKRLAEASQSQLNNFTLSYTGIHWPELDEDLSFEGMFHHCGLCERTETEDSVCYEK